MRDAVDSRFYEDQCFELIAKFKTLRSTLGVRRWGGDGEVAARGGPGPWRLSPPLPLTPLLPQSALPDMDRFIAEYRLDRDCPLAVNRLMRAGVPATVEHGAGAGARSGSSAGAAAHVAEAVQHFITIMDSLKLNMVAADQVYPLLNDLLVSLSALRLGGPGSATPAGPVKVKGGGGGMGFFLA